MAGNYDHFGNVERSAQRDAFDWQTDALCAQTNPDAFVLAKGGASVEAKRVCGQCDVGLQCLLHALDISETDGVYGGMTNVERKKLLEKSRAEIERIFLATQAINKRR